MAEVPRPESLSPARLAALSVAPITYPEVGATAGDLPTGYAHLDRTRQLGVGR